MKKGLFFLLFMVAFVFKGFSQSTPADSTEMYAYIDSVLAEARGPIKRTDFFNLLTTFNSYMAVQGVNGTGLLSAGDTASMLSSYTRYVEFLDSISDLRSDLGAGAVQPSDTAAMLTPYISRSDTAAMLTPYISRSDTAAMLQSYLQRGDTAAMLQYFIERSDTAAMLLPYISRSDTASMLNTYRRKSDMVVATDYTGINNDGTTISQANFTAFITATNNRQVYWPAGTYAFAASAVDINPTSTNINWVGEGQNTVLSNFDDFSPQGDYLIVRNMKFKNCDYLFRYDATETIGTDSTLYAEFSDLFVQRVKGITRYPETAEQWVHHIKFDNIKYDTITGSGVGISVNGGAGIIECTNLYFNGTLDSTAISPLSLSSEQDGGRGIDTAIYVDNVVINNFWVREGFGTAANFYNIYAEAQEGTVIKISNIKIANTNLPLVYLRGSTTTIFDGIDIRTDTLRTDFVGPVIICKSPGTDHKPSMILKNSHIDVPDITAVYKENTGNVVLRNNYIKVNGASKYCFNVSHNADPNYDWTVDLYDNTFINKSASSPLLINIPSFVQYTNIVRNNFILPTTSSPSGASSVLLAGVNLGVNAKVYTLTNNYFFGARFDVGVRYVDIVKYTDNHFVGSGANGFSAQKAAIIQRNVFEGYPVDSVIGTGSALYDWQFYAASTPIVDFSFNHFNLKNILRVFNVDIGTQGFVDSIIMRGNTGTIKSAAGSGGKMLRVDSVRYLEMTGNNINFTTPGASHLVFVENAITDALVSGNHYTNAGSNFSYFFEGLSGANIYNLKSFDNSGFDALVETADISVNYDTIKTSQIADLSGNAYLTTKSSGWAHYIDTAYATAADSFYVAQGSTLTLPIKADMTAALVTNYLPNGVDSLFSQQDSTILGIATGASYTVRVTFKAKNSSNTGYATLALDIGTGGTPNIATAESLVFPKGAGVETQESKTILLYSLDTFVANGCKIKVTADTGNLEIYDIRLLIRLDSRP